MRKSKIKNVRVMIGSGEHSMFITVPKGKKVMLEDGTFIRAGITSEEAKNEFLEKENKIIEDIERKQLKDVFYQFSIKNSKQTLAKKCILFD